MTNTNMTNTPAHIQVQTLDPISLSFDGSSLIEASAGTGKTYTISGLYLRLLLGHGGQAPLTCEQILVVTFTNAATEELRDRIRKRIQAAYQRFLGLETDDEFIEQLYQQTADAERSNALKRFDLALKTLDEAAIYTIHGFCQRILSDMAFESSLLFESEFTLDDNEFMHHAVRDFWREICYPMSPLIAGVVSDKTAHPDILGKKLSPLLGASQAITSIDTDDFIALAEKLQQSVQRLKLRWAAEQQATFDLLNQLPLNGTTFGKLADGYPKLLAQYEAMTHWASSGFGLPPVKALKMLTLSNLKLKKGGEIPTPQQAPLLAHIEQVLLTIEQIIPAFLIRAQAGIKQRFVEQKQQRNIMTPDDLLVTLSTALTTQASSLPQAIARRFPIALIDEFQDTDPLQFAIFNQVYQNHKPITPKSSAANDLQTNDNCASTKSSNANAIGILMIGDPKQAIYAFRGADIYTYISARNQTKQHYHLDTNYRSSANLVKGVNALFHQHSDPFINQAIPFESVATPPHAEAKLIVDEQNDDSALRIRLLSETSDGLSKSDATEMISADAANQIANLLNQANTHQCNIKDKPVQAKDIAVLVRDRHEAAAIKTALNERDIGAVFLSRDSVFNTNEANELALILAALATPKDERKIRAALATQLLGYNALQIDQFNHDEQLRQQVLDNVMQWHELWLSRGIMPALLQLASDSQLVHRLLSSKTPTATGVNDEALPQQVSGERRLTDFRHLAELLQQKATELDGTSALLNWFEQQLIDKHSQDEQQLRLESEQNLVQIVTIHKSKGLEYPICFVPFVSLVRTKNTRPEPLLYHENEQLIWDVLGTDEAWELQKQEVLAEDLRLLYVALTRPVYRCYLSIANQSSMLKKGIKSLLNRSAIGYLLGITDDKTEFADLQQKLTELAIHDAISVNTIDECSPVTTWHKVEQAEQDLAPKSLSRTSQTPWRVGSYSGLVKHLAHEKVSPGADDEAFELSETLPMIDEQHDSEVNDRFSFERGANAGSFMHLVMELFDFTQAQEQLPAAIEKAMTQYGYDSEMWLEPLQQWYQQILATPLTVPNSPQPITLAQLPPKQVMVEMEFYLPLNQLRADKLNALLHQYGYQAGLSFDTLKGMLKGFIDLTFEHNGQYFIADYKSNHLGNGFDCYHQNAMQQAIDSHRYNLQYILYTLALHRYLKLRKPDYQYSQHIGGCYYLFLRGMSPQHLGCGVFFDLPPQALIEALDDMFSQSATQECSPC